MLQDFGRDMEYGNILFLFLWFNTSIIEELKTVSGMTEELEGQNSYLYVLHK